MAQLGGGWLSPGTSPRSFLGLRGDVHSCSGVSRSIWWERGAGPGGPEMDVGSIVSSRRLFQGDSLFGLQFLLPTWLFREDTWSILDKGPQLTKRSSSQQEGLWKHCWDATEGGAQEGRTWSILAVLQTPENRLPARLGLSTSGQCSYQVLPARLQAFPWRQEDRGRENSLEASLPTGPESMEIFQVHSWVPVAGNSDPI